MPRRAGHSRAGEADKGKQLGRESEHAFDASPWAAVDKDDARTWPVRPWRWRSAEGGATAWPHMVSAVTRQRRARLSGG
jgi:hypothetical protein